MKEIRCFLMGALCASGVWGAVLSLRRGARGERDPEENSAAVEEKSWSEGLSEVLGYDLARAMKAVRGDADDE